MHKCLACTNWGKWEWHEECHPFKEGCGQFQPASAAQIFFQARGIFIPDLDPHKWAENVKETGGAPSARFYQNVYTQQVWYESGSGATRAVIKNSYLLVFDLTNEIEHQEKLMSECRRALEAANIKVIDPATRNTWPQPGQVGYIPIGSFDPLWEGTILVGCLPTRVAGD